MDKGHFYFLSDNYYNTFGGTGLMHDPRASQNGKHDRPCMCAFKDPSNDYFWMIPVTSKVAKFNTIHSGKIAKYGRCDTIDFSNILGHDCAFLIQNMCPVTTSYLKNEYLDPVYSIPVRIRGDDEKRIIAKAKRVLSLHRKGYNLLFTDIGSIESKI